MNQTELTVAIEKDIDLNEELQQAFLEIQIPRTPYALEQLVVHSKFTKEQCYAQCVLEMSIAYDNLRTAKCNAELKEIEISEIDQSTRKGELQATIKKVELEQLNRARLGAVREFQALYNIWKSFPKQYTREEMDAASPEEYRQRLLTQASQDLNASGRISVGNQEGMRTAGILTTPRLDYARDIERKYIENSVDPTDFIREVDKKYLETGKSRLLLAVATEEKAVNGLPCIEGLSFPNGTEVKIFNCWGRKVDDAYNEIVQTALFDKADFVFTVEDDTFPDKDALIKLMNLLRENPKSAVGAWYPKREPSKQGVHIELINGVRQAMKDDGKIHEAYTMACGCSLYPIEMFMQIPYPWFKTTANLSQDSFFSQLARDAGYKLLVDTSIKCKHIDRVTGEVFE